MESFFFIFHVPLGPPDGQVGLQAPSVLPPQVQDNHPPVCQHPHAADPADVVPRLRGVRPHVHQTDGDLLALRLRSRVRNAKPLPPVPFERRERPEQGRAGRRTPEGAKVPDHWGGRFPSNKVLWHAVEGERMVDDWDTDSFS